MTPLLNGSALSPLPCLRKESTPRKRQIATYNPVLYPTVPYPVQQSLEAKP